MKVLFIIYSYPPEVRAGWQEFTKKLAQEFKEAGYNVTIVVSRSRLWLKGINFKKREDGIVVFRIPEIKIPFIRYIFELYSTLMVAVLEFPDVIFGMSLSPGGIISSFLGKILKAKNFLYIVGRELIEGPAFFRRFAGNIFTHLSDKILCATEFAKSTLPKPVKKKAHTVPLFIDITPYPSCQVQNNLSSVVNILYVGRIIQEKGLDLLLQALYICKLKIKNCKLFLRIIGSGDKEKEYKALAKKLLSEDEYEFLGYIEKEKLPMYYTSADLLVLPSRSETFGLVILEANFFGLPVVATKVMGIPYIVKDGVNGILVEPAPESIAEGIKKLVNDKELYNSIKNRAKNYADTFVKKRIVKQLRKIVKI